MRTESGITMNPATSDKTFAGSIPQIYESYLVPLIFQPFAIDLVQRLKQHQPSRVLEVAAGTGVVTRLMASTLGEGIDIVATDLNQAMLDQAKSIGTRRPVEWRQADAMALPFDDASFDAVVVQFGAMFFPDKAKAFAEARRVLRDGGLYLFNVWDRIKDNEFAATVTSGLEAIFPQDPPRFLARTPHGYCDRQRIRQDLASGGFTRPPPVTPSAAPSRAASAPNPANAFRPGTPVRHQKQAPE